MRIKSSNRWQRNCTREKGSEEEREGRMKVCVCGGGVKEGGRERRRMDDGREKREQLHTYTYKEVSRI